MQRSDADFELPSHAALAAIAIFIVAGAWRFLTFTGFTNDHYAHLALAQQILLGDLPVRDFTDPGWPLTYLASAAAWLVAGDAMGVEWLLTAGALSLSAALTVVIAARLSGYLAIGVLAAILELIIYPRTYAYPKLLAYALAAAVIMAVARRPTRTSLWLPAASIATAFLFRHDHGLYIGLAMALCVAASSRVAGMRTAAIRVGMLTLFTAALLSPWALYVTTHGGLPAYFDRAIEFAAAEANASNLRSWPAFDRRPGEPLFGLAPRSRPVAEIEWRPGTPVSLRREVERRHGLEWVSGSGETHRYHVADTTEQNLRAIADHPQVDGTSGFGRLREPAWRRVLTAVSPLRLAPALQASANADAWLFWLFWTLPVVACAVSVIQARRRQERWPGELAAVAALIVLAICVNIGFLRDVLRTRLSDAIVPAVLLLAWLLGAAWRAAPGRALFRMAIRGVAVTTVLVSLLAIGHVGEFRDRWGRTGIPEGATEVRARAAWVWQLLTGPHRQAVSPPSHISTAMMPFFSFVDRCSAPEERVLVTGEFPDIVVLAGRRFASDGVVMGAWYSSVRHQQETLDSIRTRQPLFVISLDPAAFTNRYPEIAAHIDREYRTMGTLDVQGGGTVQILVNGNRRPQGTDVETGWPCYR